MTTMSEKGPLDWVKQVERVLYDLDERPQFGLPLDFNWTDLEKKLQTLFERPDLALEERVKGWVQAESLKEGLGENPLLITVEWSPLLAPAYFSASEQDLKKLMAELLGGEKRAAYFYDPSLVLGFYQYFVAELLSLLEELNLGAPLAPRLGEIKETLPQGPCFVLDVGMNLNGYSFWGRILLPESLRQEWRHYFSNRPPPPLSLERQEKLFVDVSFEIGHTALNVEQWKGVHEGDFILLDLCTYDPLLKKGGVVLSVDQKPLFRGRFKEEGIKLTEYPIYEEVSQFMEKEPFAEDTPEDEEDEDLYGDELPEEHDEDFKEKRAEGRPTSLSAEEIPIHLTIEVARLKMTAKELLNLSPGDLLKMDVVPEQGVDLVINGKKVGRGELIRVGEALGVRILSL